MKGTDEIQKQHIWLPNCISYSQRRQCHSPIRATVKMEGDKVWMCCANSALWKAGSWFLNTRSKPKAKTTKVKWNFKYWEERSVLRGAKGHRGEPSVALKSNHTAATFSLYRQRTASPVSNHRFARLCKGHQSNNLLSVGPSADCHINPHGLIVAA